MTDVTSLISIWAFLGFATKYIDEVFDEQHFSKLIASLLAPTETILGVYLLVSDFYSRQLLLAILLAVVVSPKVDSWVFQLNCAVFLGLGLIYHLTIAPLSVDWRLVIIAALAGILDELGNDFVEQRKSNCFITSFFQHRWAMKAIVLGFGWANLLPITHVVAFLVFDSAYETVSSASKQRLITENC